MERAASRREYAPGGIIYLKPADNIGVCGVWSEWALAGLLLAKSSPERTPLSLDKLTMVSSTQSLPTISGHAASVRALCARRIGFHELDDAVQDVFLRALQTLDRLEDPNRLASYLHGIARNLCIDRLRLRRRRDVSLSDLRAEPADPAGPPEIELELRKERLQRELERLPRTQAEVVTRFYYDGLSHAQIAEELDTTPAAVNQRLARARTELRAAFRTAS